VQEYGAPFVKILYLTDLAQNLLSRGYGLRWATFRKLESHMSKSGYVNHVQN